MAGADLTAVLGSTTDRMVRKVCSPVFDVSNPAHNVMTAGQGGKNRGSRILYYSEFSPFPAGMVRN